jgi:hypothetical protein
MALTLVYPADYFKPHAVDPDYRAEAEAFQARSQTVSTWDGQVLRPAPVAGTRLLYRGWMLSGLEYTQLYSHWANLGYMLKTPPEHYGLCHYLHRWYHSLQALTPETDFIEADKDALDILQATLKVRLQQGWTAGFIKDAVKSLKTAGGSRVDTPEDVERWFAEMKHYRQALEWPICLRAWESWRVSTERRYFVYQEQLLVPPEAKETPIPELIATVMARIDSPFYTLDVVQNEEGQWRLVELGDGQVSDHKGWEADTFVQDLLNVL